VADQKQTQARWIRQSSSIGHKHTAFGKSQRFAEFPKQHYIEDWQSSKRMKSKPEL